MSLYLLLLFFDRTLSISSTHFAGMVYRSQIFYHRTHESPMPRPFAGASLNILLKIHQPIAEMLYRYFLKLEQFPGQYYCNLYKQLKKEVAKKRMTKVVAYDYMYFS